MSIIAMFPIGGGHLEKASKTENWGIFCDVTCLKSILCLKSTRKPNFRKKNTKTLAPNEF